MRNVLKLNIVFIFFLMNMGLYANAINDSLVVEALKNRAMELFNFGNDSGFILIDSAIQRSFISNNKQKLAECYKYKGVGYYFNGENTKAITAYLTAKQMYVEVGDSVGIANCYHNIAIVHTVKGEYKESIENNLKALRIREQLNLTSEIAKSYTELGISFQEIGDVAKAIAYMQRALKIHLQHADSFNIAGVYLNLGTVYSEKDHADSAFFYYSNALDIYESLGNKNKSATCLLNIGNYFANKNELKRAMDVYDKSLAIAKEVGNVRTELSLLNSQSVLLWHEGEYNKAIQLSIKAKNRVENTNYLPIHRNIMYNLSQLYIEVSDTSNAYNAFIDYINLKDSIANIEKHKQITELETKYETEKKEREIELLKKDNEVKSARMLAQRRLSLFLISIFTLSAFLAYLYYQNSKVRNRNIRNELVIKNLKTEQKVLRSQMNPHFIYNSLNSIQSFISADESYQAEKYLARFAKLMRGILENSRKEMVTLDKELEVLNLYLELEQLRFEKRFVFEVNVDRTIETDFIQIPPMLIQPFLENAILHGFNGVNNGLLKLNLFEYENKLICEIEDNGIGREASAKFKRDSKKESLATKITNERLSTLSKQVGKKAGFEIVDKKDDVGKALGTTVILTIPLKEEDIG